MPTATYVPSKEDEAEFWKAADSKLIRYGGKWTRRNIVRAVGTQLWDSQGNRILDFTSGQMSSLIGHAHPEICDVVDHSMRTLDHLFSAMVTDPVVNLSKALTDVLPQGLDRCMYLSTGSESNECALKLAKMYTGCHEVVSFSGSYHGMTGGAAAATFSTGRRGYGPHMVGNLVLPSPYAYRSRFRNADGSYNWRGEMDYGWDLIDRQSCGQLACVIVEPILSTAGIIELPVGYLKYLKEQCVKRGMLLIVDEAQTGVGRTGDMFAFERDGVVPDILTLSKTLGAGLPLAATICSEEIEQACFKKGFFYYTTHLNDPLPAAVGLKVMEIAVRDDLPAQAKHKGKLLKDGLYGLQRKYPCIGDVRGRGLLLGIEIVLDIQKTPADQLGTSISSRCLELGLSCNVVQLPGMGGTFRIAPPLTILESEIAEGLAIMDQAIADCLAMDEYKGIFKAH